MSPFRTTRRVEFVDTDLVGIVHFSNFFRYMEAAEVDFLHSLGLSVKMTWQDRPIGFPRVAASCDYLKPAKFEDVLDIAVTVKNLGRKSVTYGFDFSRGGEAVARGQITAVCVEVFADRSFASLEIPESIRRALAAQSANPSS
jgi:YbgC/YbaW family acyl-CoA thioester hydrolase